MKNTPWAVHCWNHGKVVLSKEQYDFQMSRPNYGWFCPLCREPADWDDAHHDAFYEDEGA